MLKLILLVSLSFPPTRAHKYKLLKQSVRVDTCKYSIANRVFNAWNNLPASVFYVMNANNFKTCLNDVNLSALKQMIKTQDYELYN